MNFQLHTPAEWFCGPQRGSCPNPHHSARRTDTVVTELSRISVCSDIKNFCCSKAGIIRTNFSTFLRFVSRETRPDGGYVASYVTAAVGCTATDFDCPSVHKISFIKIILYRDVSTGSMRHDPHKHPCIDRQTDRQTDRRYCNRIHDKCIRYLNMYVKTSEPFVKLTAISVSTDMSVLTDMSVHCQQLCTAQTICYGFVALTEQR